MSPEQIDTWLKIFTLVATIAGLSAVIFRLGKATSKFEQIGKQQSQEIVDLKMSVTDINKTLVQVALQTDRLNGLSERQTRVEKLIDDLRRGEGFILPLMDQLRKHKD